MASSTLIGLGKLFFNFGDFNENTEHFFILLFFIKKLKNDFKAEIFLAIELEEISEFLL